MMLIKDTKLYLHDYQYEAAEDAIVVGSDGDESPITNADRIRRRHEIGRAYLRGHVPFIQSAQLKGPFDQATGWVNPWRHITKEPVTKNSRVPARNEWQGSRGVAEAVVPKPTRPSQTLRRGVNTHYVQVDQYEPLSISNASLGGDVATGLRDEASRTMDGEDLSNLDVFDDSKGELRQQEGRKRLGKSGSILAEGKQVRKRRAETLWLKGGHIWKQPRINPPQARMRTPEISSGSVFRNEPNPPNHAILAKAVNREHCTPKRKRISHHHTTPVDWDSDIETTSPTTRHLLARNHQLSPLGSQYGRGSSNRATEGQHLIVQPKLTTVKTDVLKQTAQLDAPRLGDSHYLSGLTSASGLKYTASSDVGASDIKSRSPVRKANRQFRERVTENLVASNGRESLTSKREESYRELSSWSSADTLNNSLALEPTINNKISNEKLPQGLDLVDEHLSTPSGSFRYHKRRRVANFQSKDASPADIQRREHCCQISPRGAGDDEKNLSRTLAFSDTESPVTPKSFSQPYEEHLKISEESLDSGLSWVTVDSIADGQSSGILNSDAINEVALSSPGMKVIDNINSTRYSEWGSTRNTQAIHSCVAEPNEVQSHEGIALTSSAIRRLSTASTQTQASPPALSPVSPRIVFDKLVSGVVEKDSVSKKSEVMIAAEPKAYEFHTPSSSPPSSGCAQIDSIPRTIRETHGDVALQSPWAGDRANFLTRPSGDKPSWNAEHFHDSDHESQTKSLCLNELKDESFNANGQVSDSNQGTLDEVLNLPVQSKFQSSPELIVLCGSGRTVSGSQILLNAVTVNPWNSASTHSRPGKSKKKVSFGPIPNDRSECSQDSAASQPHKSPPPPPGSQRLSKINDKFHWRLKGTRELACAEETDSRFPNVYQNEAELPRSSPAIGAMAAAFIAADRKNASNGRSALTAHDEYAAHDNLGSRVNITEDFQTKLTRKSLLKSTTIDDCNFSVQAAVSQIDHLQDGLYSGVDVDAVIEDMGDFLEGWDVEAEVCKVGGTKSSGDHVHRDRRRDHVSSLANR